MFAYFFEGELSNLYEKMSENTKKISCFLWKEARNAWISPSDSPL